MSMITRYVKKSLVENPYITLTAGLCIVGMAMPTWVYYNGGREKEAAMRFDLVRSVIKGGERTRTEGWRVMGRMGGWARWLGWCVCGVMTADWAGGASVSVPASCSRRAINIRASMHRQTQRFAFVRDAH